MDLEEASVALAHHEERLCQLEREVCVMKEVQAEIRTMNETLVVLASELKHTNLHLARHEAKLDALEAAPRERGRQILTGVLAALAAACATALITLLFG